MEIHQIGVLAANHAIQAICSSKPAFEIGAFEPDFGTDTLPFGRK